MEGTLTGVARSAPEGGWVPGGGIGFPCEYICTVRCEKGPRNRKANTPKSTSQENGKKTELYVPMSYCLV